MSRELESRACLIFYFSMSGIPVINGFNQIEFAGLMWKSTDSATKGQMGFALGIVFRNIRFDQILEKLLGIDNIPLAWLSEMTAG